MFSYAGVGAPAYVGTGQGYPEKIHSRVSPDHGWFLNQQDEIVSIRDGTRRPLQLERPLGRPVLFLDAKQLVTLTPEGEFLWVELDPDRVTYTAPAPGGQGGELQNRVPLMRVSGPRNALYYEVGRSHYVYDLESAEGFHVGSGEDTHFLAFTSEGDMACLRVSRRGSRDEIVLVDVKTGAKTVVPWSGSLVHYPLTGPEAWQTLRLGAAPGKGEFPTFDVDPTSQIAAWRFGLKAEVFRIQDLPAGTRPRRYDLEDAW